jgi:hypothetical protein
MRKRIYYQKYTYSQYKTLEQYIYVVHWGLRPAFQPNPARLKRQQWTLFIVADRQPPWQKGFVQQLSISSARREPNGAELKWNAARALHSCLLQEQRWRGPNPTPLRVCLIIYCLSPLTSINRSRHGSCAASAHIYLASLAIMVIAFSLAVGLKPMRF